MNKENILIGSIVSISAILVISLLVQFSIKSEVKSGNSYQKCVVEMYQAIPDPNDTESRMLFLKNCQND